MQPNRLYTRTWHVAALLVVAPAAWAVLRELPNDKLVATTTAAALGAKGQKSLDYLSAADRIVAATNEFRDEQDLEPLKVNTKLAETATYFADYMARTDKYSHTADGKEPWERAKERGYEYCLVSENIAYLSSSVGVGTEELAGKLVEVWIESPEHRTNMLDPAVTETGVAVAHSSKTGRSYGVQMFGRPASMRFNFAIENQSKVSVDYTIGDRSYDVPPTSRRTHEECLPVDLVFQLHDKSETKRFTFRPKNGDRFIVSGRLEVEKK